jgi:hypothetical protein
MVSILLVGFLVLFLAVNFLALAFCRSAALTDRKLESLHIKQTADFSSAITRPIGKRGADNSRCEHPNVALKQYGLLPKN